MSQMQPLNPDAPVASFPPGSHAPEKACSGLGSDDSSRVNRQIEEILNHISDAFIAMDRDWTITYVNPSYVKLVSPLYASAGELVGHNLWERFPDIVDQEVGERYRQAMATQRPDYIELLYAPLDAWLEIRVQPSPNSLGIYVQDITERKRAEAALRESEERYRTLFNSIDEGFCVFDMILDQAGTPLDYRFVETNPAFERHTGLTGAIGRTLRELVPNPAENWFTIYGEVARTGTPVRFTNSDPGLGRHFEAYAFRMGGAGSQRVAVIFSDISERFHTEKALKTSEERYRTLFTSLQDGFCVFQMIYDEAGVAVDYRFVEVNPAFENHTDLKDVVGRTIRELVPSHEPHWFDIYGRVAETGVSVKFQHVGAGMGRWFEVSAFRMGAAEDRLVAAVFTDITSRHMTEQALRESEERYRSLFNSIDEGVCLCEMLYDDAGRAVDYRILEVNPAFTTSTGLSMSRVLGRTARELDLVPETRIEMYARVLATGEPVRYESHVTALGRWFDIFVSRVGGEGSRHFVPVFSDITQKRLAQEELRSAKETAEAANEAKDRFLAVLSHELRTPLTPVLMTAAAREADPTLPSSIREDMVMIRRNVELETKLIDDLLDLSRITSGKLVLRTEAVDLNTAVKQVCSICLPQILEKNIRLHTRLLECSAWVLADPARLQQVLWNLLKNAAKFTPEDGEIQVRTLLSDEGRSQVVVSDNGIGIDPGLLPRIFDAFEQGEARITRQFGGLGLGLAISKALTELHGGTLAAASDGPGQGSVFTLSLPSETVVRHAPTQRPQVQDRTGGAVGGVRVLLAEDHEDTARILSMLLTRAGFKVSVTHSVAEAVRHAADQQVDVLVSDIGLPDGTGYELMRRLRQAHPHLLGVAMSGFGMDEDIRKSSAAGFGEHLVKPVDALRLQHAIERVLDQRGGVGDA